MRVPNLLPSIATLACVSKPSSRQRATNCAQTLEFVHRIQFAAPLSVNRFYLPQATPSFRARALITRGHNGANRQWLSVAQYREFRHLADSQECHSIAQESRAHDSPVAKP